MTELLNQAIAVAQREILRPSLGVVEQALAIHEPFFDEGLPRVAYTEHGQEPNAFFVYFPLVNEPYYLVVVIRIVDTEPEVSTAHFEAAVDVSLVVTSEILLPHIISQMLGIKPTTTHAKGAPLRSSKRVAPFTLWQFEPHHDVLGDIEYKLHKLFSTLEPYSANITTFSNQADTTTHIFIRIIYKGYSSQMWGWSMSLGTIKQLASLNMGVDLDIHASGPDLPD